MLRFHPEAINVQWGASESPCQQESEVQPQPAAQMGQQIAAQLAATQEHSQAAQPMSSQQMTGMPPPGYSFHPAGGITPTSTLEQPVQIPGQQHHVPGQSFPPQSHYQSPPSFYSPDFGSGIAFPPHPVATWHCPADPSATMSPSAQPQMPPEGATWMHVAQRPP